MKGILAERLTALRKANGMTATQCAAELEISIAAWSQWEKAKRDPSLSDLPKICWIFGVTMDELFQTTNKLCAGRNVSARAGTGGIAIAGSGNSVTGVVAPSTKHQAPSTTCAKCPYKKKLKALEKLIQK